MITSLPLPQKEAGRLNTLVKFQPEFTPIDGQFSADNNTPGEFQQQYAELVRAGIDRALESNAVAQALDKYLVERVLPINWQGTAGQLYDLLNTHSLPDRSSWPRSPKGLSDQLRRIAPAYRAKGIDITHLGHSREGARWRIAQTRSQTNPATPPGIEGGTRYGAHRE